MDPVTLIVAALGAGAAAAAQETAGQAVKDAYQGLRGLLRRLFADRPGPGGGAEVDRFEREPEAAEAPLRDALARAGADRDPEVIAAAQEVLATVDPEGAAAGKFNVSVEGNVQGMVAGDHAQVTMTFGDPPKGA